MSRKLKSRQVKAAHMLAACIPAVEVARKLKIRPETLSRWKKIPQFSEEFEKLVEQMRHDLQYRMVRLGDRSMKAIENQLDMNCYEKCDVKRVEIALNLLKLVGIALEPVSKTPEPAKEEAKNAAYDASSTSG